MLQSLYHKIRVNARQYLNNNTPEMWENFFGLFYVSEEFLFYRPVKQSRDGEAEGTGLHVNRDGVPVDTQLVEQIVETMISLNLNKHESQSYSDAEEKKVHLRGHKEFLFFNDILSGFRLLTSTSREHEQIKCLTSLSKTLNERTKSLFNSIRPATTDLNKTFNKSLQKVELRFI